MRPRHEGPHHAGAHPREQFEARHGPVFDVRAFARHFVIIGIDGGRVRVRRKSDRVEGTLAYISRPLQFSDFRLATGGRRP